MFFSVIICLMSWHAPAKQLALQVSFLHTFSSEVIIMFFHYQLFDHVSQKPSRETLLCQMA